MPELKDPGNNVPQLIVIDLDGTLLNSRKEIDPRDCAAVIAAGDRARVVIATARPPRATRMFCGGLQLRNPVICYNGALIVDIETGERMVDERIPPEVGEAVVRGLLHRWPETWISMEVNDAWWTDRQPPAILVESAKLSPPDRIEPMESFYGQPWSKIILSRPRPILMEMMAWLKEEYNSSLHYVATEDGSLLQIMSPRAGKLSAVKTLCEKWSIPRERVMAFGDDRNDAPLLEWAGIGVAMGNAIDEVKAIANHVTETNDAAGVAIALNQYLNHREVRA